MGVEAEQDRLVAVELAQRHALERVAVESQPVVARDDRARVRARLLLAQPGVVAAARVADAVERRSRKGVVHVAGH